MNLSELGFDGLPAGGLVLATIAVFGGAVLRGFTGFGFALAAVPALTLVFDPVLAVPAMLILQMLATFQSLPQAHRSIHWPALGWLVAGALVGMPAGTALLATLPADMMRLLIGLVMLAAVAALWCGFRFARMPGVPARLGVGTLSGVLSGAAALPGPPVIVFFLASPASAAVSRASLLAYFLFTAAGSMGFALASGLVGWPTVTLALLLAPALILGNWAGEKLFLRAPGGAYRPVALSVLLAIGLVATGRAVWGLLIG
jgi:uncharacterized membrane protein YfcA